MSNKILCVEDNGANRMLIRDILLYHGYEVLEAENGKEALKVAREQMPDLILMDIQMPEMDGVTALQILKSDPSTNNLKVVAFTSFAMRGDEQKLLDEGFSGYVAKPINTRELPNIVRRFLDGPKTDAKP